MIATHKGSAAMQEDDKRAREHQDASHRSAAEWTTLILSGLIVATLIGAAFVEYFWVDEARGVKLEVSLAQEQTRHLDDLYTSPSPLRTPAQMAPRTCRSPSRSAMASRPWRNRPSSSTFSRTAAPPTASSSPLTTPPPTTSRPESARLRHRDPDGTRAALSLHARIEHIPQTIAQ